MFRLLYKAVFRLQFNDIKLAMFLKYENVLDWKLVYILLSAGNT